MKLATVSSTLDDHLRDGVLHLDVETAGSMGLGSVLAALDSDGLHLRRATVNASGPQLTVSGTASILGAASAVVTMVFTKSGGSTDIVVTATFEDWRVPGASWLDVSAAALTLSLPAGGALSIEVTGAALVAGFPATLTAQAAERLTIRLTAARLTLSTLAEQVTELSGLAPDLPVLELTGVEVTITPSTGAFRLAAGGFDTPWMLLTDTLQLRDLHLTIERSIGDGEGTIATHLEGTLDVGTASVTAVYDGPGELMLTASVPSVHLGPLVQDLCGPAVAMGLDVPAAVLDVAITDVELRVQPSRREVRFSASSPFGALLFCSYPAADGYGFLAVFQPPSGWRFSTLGRELAVLDGLDFGGTVLALTNDPDVPDDVEMPGLPDGAQLVDGLNLFASLSAGGTGLDELLGVRQLEVYATVGSRPTDMVIGCSIDARVELAEDVVFGQLSLELRPSPTAFSLLVTGVVEAEIDGSDLRFTGGLEIQPRSANLQATMEGTWDEPLGATGVALSDVAIELGLSYPPLVPTIGFAGTLRIGEFVGSAAVRFNAAAPGETMLAVSFNELHLLGLVSAFCGPEIAASIPRELTQSVLDIGFEEVELAVVPQATTIGEIHFEQGTTVRGAMTFWGARGRASLVLDYASGVSGSASLDPVSVANGALTLRGANGAGGPSLALELAPLKVPNVELAGAVSLLGLTAETQLRFSSQGFQFHAEGRIFNLFWCRIDATGSNVGPDSDVYLRVAMRNDLFEYLRREATEAIRASADAATRELQAAQRDVAAAQADVNQLDQEIAATRRTIAAERERDARNLREAQVSLAAAQREVSRLDGEIEAMRRTINAERDRDTRNLQKATADVAAAQRDVNSLQSEINSTKAYIERLKGDIDAKRRWYDRLAWYDKTWGWTVLSGVSAAKGAEITANYTKIGALEASKHTAIGVLEAAKLVLKSFQSAAKTVPIEADPRLVGLYTARGSAFGALELAKQTLRGFEQAAKTIPIDADPRIVGLFTALGAATGALTAANAVLEGVEASVGGLADVGSFIAKAGLGGLIDIRAASFEAYLSAAATGRVRLDLTLSFMDQPQRLSLAVNLVNPLSAAQELAAQLMG